MKNKKTIIGSIFIACLLILFVAIINIPSTEIIMGESVISSDSSNVIGATKEDNKVLLEGKELILNEKKPVNSVLDEYTESSCLNGVCTATVSSGKRFLKGKDNVYRNISDYIDYNINGCELEIIDTLDNKKMKYTFNKQDSQTKNKVKGNKCDFNITKSQTKLKWENNFDELDGYDEIVIDKTGDTSSFEEINDDLILQMGEENLELTTNKIVIKKDKTEKKVYVDPEVSLVGIASLSGHIRDSNCNHVGYDLVNFGDNYIWTGVATPGSGIEYRGFATFNTTSLENATIVYNHTLSWHISNDAGSSNVHAYSCNYGDSFEVGDYGAYSTGTDLGVIFGGVVSAGYHNITSSVEHINTSSTTQYCLKIDRSCADTGDVYYTSSTTDLPILYVEYSEAPLNSVPSVSVPSFSPVSPTSNDVINWSFVVTDDDNDSMNITVVHSVDGVVVSWDNRTDVANGTTIYSVVGSGNFSKDDNVSINITANDGTVDSSMVYNSTLISNIVSVLSNPVASPSSPLQSQDITWSFTITDDDNDSMNLTVVHSVDGVVVSWDNRTDVANGTIINSIIGSGNYSVGDNVSINITPVDGGLMVYSSVNIIVTPTTPAPVVEGGGSGGGDFHDTIIFSCDPGYNLQADGLCVASGITGFASSVFSVWDKIGLFLFGGEYINQTFTNNSIITVDGEEKIIKTINEEKVQVDGLAQKLKLSPIKLVTVLVIITIILVALSYFLIINWAVILKFIISIGFYGLMILIIIMTTVFFWIKYSIIK